MTRAILIALVVVVVGYGLFEARRLIEGPVITIYSPASGTATSSALLTITGSAQNISFLTVNDMQAFTDTSGHFSITLSPPSGYTIITVAALDRFGRRAQKKVELTVLTYCPMSSLFS
jgi:hypothetical protein